MTRPWPSMPEDGVLTLQRCLVALALGEETDPGVLARGLPRRDRAAFRRFRDRLLVYREGVQAAIWEPMDRYCPLTQALLAPAGAWEALRQDFLATRSLTSPYYRDIAPTFLGWLASSGWGREEWPFLLQLVHFELVKELVEQGPDDLDAPALRAAPAPGDRMVLAASTQVLAYAYRVHEATLDRPEPASGPCRLLAHRGGDGYIRWLELTDAAATLLVRAREEPVGTAAAAVGLGPDQALGFLADLVARGAVLGFTDG